MRTTCPLCGVTDHSVVSERDRHGAPLRTVVCMGCGIITNDPIPSDEELAEFYRSNYRVAYKGAAIPSKRQVLRNFQRLIHHFKTNAEFYRKPVKGLDLGSGSGEFLFLAKAAGLEFTGVEPNKGYADYSRQELGLTVENRLLEEMSFPDGHFDMIRLSHVLEHMRDPIRSLQTLRKWLKPGGVLYIEVPQTDDEARRKLRGRMFHYGHIFNFDPFTLRLVAARAGFQEHESAARRLQGTTGTFFVPGPVQLPSTADCLANAARMKSLMDGHNARLLPAPSNKGPVSRFLAIAAQRIGEQIGGRRFANHRAIADHFGEQLRRT